MNGLTFLFHWYKAGCREKFLVQSHRYNQPLSSFPFREEGRRGKSFYPLVFSLLLALTLSACSKGVEPDHGPRANHEEGDLVITLPGGAKMAFIRLEAGTFRMGEGASPEHPGYDTDAVPAHDVTLTQPFYLGKYEVTRRQWISVMGANRLPAMPDYALEDDYPVTNVSWEDCQEFMQRLNELTGEDLYALPTEAQWEYACRAGTTGLWSYPGVAPNGDYMWHSGNSDGRLLFPVGLKLPNPWGLYDMHGNVSEWVYDWYAPYPSEPQIDPRGPDASPYPGPYLQRRVIRNGFFYWRTRSAKRSGGSSWERTGFRVMRQAMDIAP